VQLVSKGKATVKYEIRIIATKEEIKY